MFRAVGKFKGLQFAFEGLQYRGMGDIPQGQDDGVVPERLYLVMQKLITHFDFSSRGLVLRRDAFHGIGDTTSLQAQFVIPGR